MLKSTTAYSGENLSRFRYHTGATLRPLAPEDSCRILFRDVGPWAMARFLRGQLKRLAGPFAPILYARTADYREPYTDYEPIGRLVFLQPKVLNPWDSGVPTIFVASVSQSIDLNTVGFVPAQLDLRDAEKRLEGVRDIATLREVFGGRSFDEVVCETIASLDRLNAELADTERRAEPLRRRIQSRLGAEADSARTWLSNHGLSESDLCTAWHHLPRQRRDLLRAAIQELGEVHPC